MFRNFHVPSPTAAVAAVGLLLLPWTPLVSSQRDHAAAMAVTPWVLWTPLVALVIGCLVGGWLGLGVGWVALRSLTGDETALWTAAFVAFGAGALSLVSRWPRTWLRWAILCSVGAEIGLSLAPTSWIGGTFPNPAVLGIAVAVAMVLSPLWAWPALSIGLLWSHSYLMAALALVVGSIVRWPEYALPIGLAAAGLVIGYGVLVGYDPWPSVASRVMTWGSLLSDLRGWSIVVGHGPGSWSGRMWNLYCPCPPGDVWTAAHHEPLQWLYETGLVGLAILAAWMRRCVSMLRPAPAHWRGAFASVVAVSCGLQVFHLPTLAPLLILVLAGALHASSAEAQMPQPAPSLEDRLDQCTVNLGTSLQETGRLNYQVREATRLLMLEGFVQKDGRWVKAPKPPAPPASEEKK
jgi:hypothetical protein